MTITMNLELETGVTFENVTTVLVAMGAEYAFENGYLTGNFEGSGAYFVFRCYSVPEEPVAEGVNVGWKVGMSGAFHCPIKYLLESSADIRVFLAELAIETTFGFVLSFQYESLYAIRDESGIKYLKNMID